MLIAAVLGTLGGALAGWAGRALLGRLRRGVAIRPPVLEVAAALVTGLGAALAWPSATVVLVVWAGLLAVTLGAVDIAAHRLPDALTLPAIPVTAGLVLVTGLLEPVAGGLAFALVAAVIVTALFWAVAALAPRAMGLGDVKLVPSLALLTGYVSLGAVLWWLMLAFVFGAVVSLAGLATRRLSMRSAIPFGPCLLAGCWMVLAFPVVATI
jgi:leader peptidase (prepilin peptidase)/N-methyltransferase